MTQTKYKSARLNVNYVPKGEQIKNTPLREVTPGVSYVELENNSGWERVEMHDLGDDTQVMIHHIKMERPYKRIFLMEPEEPLIVLFVPVLGGLDGYFNDESFNTRLTKDEVGALSFKKAEGYTFILPGEEKSSCQFLIKIEAINRLLEGQKIPGGLAPLLDGKSNQLTFVKAKQSQTFRRIVSDTMSSPYEGATQQLFMQTKMFEVITEFIEILFAGEKQENESVSTKERRLLSNIRDLIISRIDNPPTLHELAGEAGMNYKKLNKGFKEQYGKTIFAFLRDYRLDHASAALKREDVTVAELADRLGYSHPNNFINAFKQKFGASPGKYRDSH